MYCVSFYVVGNKLYLILYHILKQSKRWKKKNAKKKAFIYMRQCFRNLLGGVGVSISICVVRN